MPDVSIIDSSPTLSTLCVLRRPYCTKYKHESPIFKISCTTQSKEYIQIARQLLLLFSSCFSINKME